MTTDPTPLQESIARALRETLTDPYGAGSDLESPGITSEGTVRQRGGEIDVPHMVEDLLPLIAAEVRKAQADAWDEGQASGWDNAREESDQHGGVGDMWKPHVWLAPNPHRNEQED